METQRDELYVRLVGLQALQHNFKRKNEREKEEDEEEEEEEYHSQQPDEQHHEWSGAYRGVLETL